MVDMVVVVVIMVVVVVMVISIEQTNLDPQGRPSDAYVG